MFKFDENREMNETLFFVEFVQNMKIRFESVHCETLDFHYVQT